MTLKSPIVALISAGLLLGGINGNIFAQDSADVEAATEKAAQAKQASKDAQKSVDDVKKQVDATAKDSAKKSDDLQKQLDAQAALLTQQTSSAQDLEKLLKDFQQQLEAQKKIIDVQQEDLAKQQTRILNQQEQLKTQTDLLTNMQSQIDQLATDKGGQLSDDEILMRERLAKLEAQVSDIPTDPSTLLADEDFPGAIRVPGTTAAYKIGGFVKANLVKNFDPLLTQDRFIVGSIPVTSTDETSLASETSMTANQSRVNFDYRHKSELGTMRAFIEADFAGDGDTFRLRHAFGQFRDMLAGKTWSAFYDAQAAPEEVDFEGINGRIVVRQTQIRYFPAIGKDWRWMISIEDPQPQVTGGTGVSDVPDLVSSIRRDWFNRWHVKTAVLLRQIRAVSNAGLDVNGQSCVPVTGTPDGQPDSEGCVAIANAGATVKETGWAITASGKVQVPWWNENDNFLFQLNYGQGLGRYLTDLSSITELEIDGGQDAVIDPSTGEMDILPIFGGYLAFQHWWNRTIRSTFVLSAVNIDNQPSQPTSAYHLTERVSANLIWSPTKNIDLGGEFLWGRRTNNGADPLNGVDNGTATQLQLEALYRF